MILEVFSNPYDSMIILFQVIIKSVSASSHHTEI